MIKWDITVIRRSGRLIHSHHIQPVINHHYTTESIQFPYKREQYIKYKPCDQLYNQAHPWPRITAPRTRKGNRCRETRVATVAFGRRRPLPATHYPLPITITITITKRPSARTLPPEVVVQRGSVLYRWLCCADTFPLDCAWQLYIVSRFAKMLIQDSYFDEYSVNTRLWL